MKNKDGVAHDALVVALRLADGAVVDAQFRQGVAGAKAEILQDVIVLFRRGVFLSPYSPGDDQQNAPDDDSFSHVQDSCDAASPVCGGHSKTHMSTVVIQVRAGFSFQSNGSRILTPAALKSRVLRVTTTALWTRAVAAIMLSLIGIALPAARRSASNFAQRRPV